MSNSGSEQRDHQRDHGTAMGDRDEGGGTSPILHCIHDCCISRGKSGIVQFRRIPEIDIKDSMWESKSLVRKRGGREL
ncbi:hypothetical protein ACOSP7_021455 [Xanthoceras sorbifolium]